MGPSQRLLVIFRQLRCKVFCQELDSVGVRLSDLNPTVKRSTCTVCGLTFARPHNLLVHMRKHTKEKPFQCRHCGKTFQQAGNLRKHVRYLYTFLVDTKHCVFTRHCTISCHSAKKYSNFIIYPYCNLRPRISPFSTTLLSYYDRIRPSDSAVFGWTWSDSVVFRRLWTALVGFGQLCLALDGFVRIRSK